MEHTPTTQQWQIIDHTTCEISDGIRCLHPGLGRILSGDEGRRPLAKNGESSTHKHVGVESSISGSTDIRNDEDQHSCATTAGQQNSYSLYQSEGRNTLKTSLGHSVQPLELVPKKGHNGTSRAHCGSGEYSSRFRIQSVSRPLRLDALETSLPQGQSEVGCDGRRPICSTTQPPDKEILQLSSGSRSYSCGCLFTGLESTSPICIPTVSARGKNSPEDPTRTSREGSINSSDMAKTAVVPIVVGNDYRPANLSPTVQQLATKPIGDNSSTTGGESTTLSRMASVRTSLQKQGICQEAAEIIFSSGRKSTEKSNTSAWNKCSGWCEERGKNSFSASIAEILTHKFNSGKQHSTINSYRSAISNTHPQIDGYPVGKHPIICRLMQGMFNERPSEPKYSEIWNIDQVLSYLE